MPATKNSSEIELSPIDFSSMGWMAVRVLILEDILAIVLMVMLSTMAVSHNFEGTEMLESIAKLLFFLILWFVVGIYLIPGLLKRCRDVYKRQVYKRFLYVTTLGANYAK